MQGGLRIRRVHGARQSRWVDLNVPSVERGADVVTQASNRRGVSGLAETFERELGYHGGEDTMFGSRSLGEWGLGG